MPEDQQRQASSSNDVYTLYFIRHGEALHNVLEKEAKEEALAEAVAQGLDPDDDITKLRMEQARMDILNNDSLQDCPLTDRGQEEACQAKKVLDGLVQEQGFPPPGEVLVSPLQRALQTADAVFPNHNDIHVREELQERQTLKACDTRQPTCVLSNLPEFSRFSMNRLRLASFVRADLPRLHEAYEEAMERSTSVTSSVATAAEEQDLGILLRDDQVEEKYMLRERTKKLFPLLQESEHRAIAIVAHKGYLRELERGPFGQENAKEFKNCEVRVYNVSFQEKGHLVTRVV